MDANDIQKGFASQVSGQQLAAQAAPFNLNQLRERLSSLDNDIYEISLLLEKQADDFLGRNANEVSAGLNKASGEITPSDLNSILLSLENRVRSLRRHANRF